MAESGDIDFLLRNKTIREFLKQFPERQWQQVVKATMIAGILALPSQQKQVLTLEDIHNRVNAKTVVLEIDAEVPKSLQVLERIESKVAEFKSELHTAASVASKQEKQHDNISGIKRPSSSWRQGTAESAQAAMAEPSSPAKKDAAPLTSTVHLSDETQHDKQQHRTAPSVVAEPKKARVVKQPRLAYSVPKQSPPPQLAKDDVVTTAYLNVPAKVASIVGARLPIASNLYDSRHPALHVTVLNEKQGTASTNYKPKAVDSHVVHEHVTKVPSVPSRPLFDDSLVSSRIKHIVDAERRKLGKRVEDRKHDWQDAVEQSLDVRASDAAPVTVSSSAFGSASHGQRKSAVLDFFLRETVAPPDNSSAAMHSVSEVSTNSTGAAGVPEKSARTEVAEASTVGQEPSRAPANTQVSTAVAARDAAAITVDKGTSVDDSKSYAQPATVHMYDYRNSRARFGGSSVSSSALSERLSTRIKSYRVAHHGEAFEVQLRDEKPKTQQESPISLRQAVAKSEWDLGSSSEDLDI
jgi:hypothetical protein